MIRGFFRLVGLLLLAGGFIFMVYDGAKWVADQTLRFTRFGQFWNDIHQSSQQGFRVWGGANWALSRKRRVKGGVGPAGVCSDGHFGDRADDPVPAAQAADRLW